MIIWPGINFPIAEYMLLLSVLLTAALVYFALHLKNLEKLTSEEKTEILELEKIAHEEKDDIEKIATYEDKEKQDLMEFETDIKDLETDTETLYLKKLVPDIYRLQNYCLWALKKGMSTGEIKDSLSTKGWKDSKLIEMVIDDMSRYVKYYKDVKGDVHMPTVKVQESTKIIRPTKIVQIHTTQKVTEPEKIEVEEETEEKKAPKKKSTKKKSKKKSSSKKKKKSTRKKRSSFTSVDDEIKKLEKDLKDSEEKIKKDLKSSEKGKKSKKKPSAKKTSSSKKTASKKTSKTSSKSKPKGKKSESKKSASIKKGGKTKKTASKSSKKSSSKAAAAAKPAKAKSKIVMATKRGSMFHEPTCIVLKKYKKENLISLPSKEEAMKKGYKPCAVCSITVE